MSLSTHHQTRYLGTGRLGGGGHHEHPRWPRLHAMHGRWRVSGGAAAALVETSPHSSFTTLRAPWEAIGATRRRRATRALARNITWTTLLMLAVVIAMLWMAARATMAPSASPAVVDPAVPLPPVPGTLAPAAGAAPDSKHE